MQLSPDQVSMRQELSLASRQLGRRGSVQRDAEERGFREWAARGGFIADREPVNFQKWRFLGRLYGLVPQTIPRGWQFTIRKAAQTGASTWAMLLMVWLSLRDRMQWGYFLPTQDQTLEFSGSRFIRMIRDNPGIHAMMGDYHAPGQRRTIDEGSKSVRKIGASIVYFRYMLGKVSTESHPLDCEVFDEVQEMDLADIMKAYERLAASPLGVKLHVSTAHFENADIDWFFQRSDQRVWLTRCQCADWCDMQASWDPVDGPLCIGVGNGSTPAVPTTPFYLCPRCGQRLPDPQDGDFVPRRPEIRNHIGTTWSQMVSPMMTAEMMLDAWNNRVDTAHFFWRKLGRCYTDPKQVPVTIAHCQAAVRPELRWGPVKPKTVDGVFMGIDQMGGDNRVVVKARVGDEMRYLWLEVIQNDDPFERCAELLRKFRVRTCCVENLPNWNDAQRFAKRFDGRVFVVNYTDLRDEVVEWGDRLHEEPSKRQTLDEVRVPWSARVDQYRAMSWSLARWARREVTMPDPRSLTQRGIRTERGKRDVEVGAMFLDHLQHVALVTAPVAGREDERRMRRSVKKIAIDPHFAYANMLADIAWMRIYGTAGFLTDPWEASRADDEEDAMAKPYDDVEQVKAGMPHLFEDDQVAIAPEHLAEDPFLGKCGSCTGMVDKGGRSYCKRRLFYVAPELAACSEYVPRAMDDDEADALEWDTDGKG